MVDGWSGGWFSVIDGLLVTPFGGGVLSYTKWSSE